MAAATPEWTGERGAVVLHGLFFVLLLRVLRGLQHLHLPRCVRTLGRQAGHGSSWQGSSWAAGLAILHTKVLLNWWWASSVLRICIGLKIRVLACMPIRALLVLAYGQGKGGVRCMACPYGVLPLAKSIRHTESSIRYVAEGFWPYVG